MSQAPTFKMTPMYEQYLGIKKQYPDAILFYRMGDFYELFFEDAEIAARELQLALTSRSKDDVIPMCGLPWHAAEAYFSQMVEKGYKVAVCDQVEDPKHAKGLVKREVTRILTAGTALDDANLQAKAHNYLGAIYWSDGIGAFAWLDASTGSWTGLQSTKEHELWQWVYKIEPKELLISAHMNAPELVRINGNIQVVSLGLQSHFDEKRSAERVMQAQKVQELDSLGLEKKPALVRVCGALLAYLEQNQKRMPSYLSAFQPLDMSAYMVLDEVTERNLELFRRYDGRKGLGTLWHELDECMTPMGGRLLEERLRYPWKDISKIIPHQEMVEHFYLEHKKSQALRVKLARVYDLERLSTRISVNRYLPRDFIALRDSLAHFPQILKILQSEEDTLLTDDALRGENVPSALGRLLRQWDNLADLSELLEKSLVDNVPVHITEGMLFKAGYDRELDDILDIVEHGEAKLASLLAHEQEKSSLPKLKIGFNRVFGYYFELNRSQQQAVPDYFERRQSLVNAERFITPELKELEEKILSASEKRNTLEYTLFQQLRNRVADERPRLLFMAGLLAQVDYWQALGYCAQQKGWVRPLLDEGNSLEIKEGRHPVVESVLGKAHFIPNDLTVDEDRRLLLITGPNMAGKSTVLRQSALICILAQMGSFVPASFAKIGVVDRVFSRVGASDNLAQGQSTFMVEMMETARILRQSTKRSLVILDEIGRGTSTFDGLALAWAVVEELIKRAHGGIRTLFATHYHELTALEGKIAGVCNMNIAIKEWNNDIVFLRKLVPGPADKSYGVEVARLAGVPNSVVQRAKEILQGLEENRARAGYRIEKNLLLDLIPNNTSSTTKVKESAHGGVNISSHVNGEKIDGEEINGKKIDATEIVKIKQEALAEHPVLKELRKIDPNSLTPLDSLRMLSEWKMLLEKEKS